MWTLLFLFCSDFSFVEVEDVDGCLAEGGFMRKNCTQKKLKK